MNEKMEKAIQAYLRRAEHLIICGEACRVEFREQMKKTIGLYFEENPEHTFEDFVRECGTPEEAAQTFMEGLDETEVKEARANRKRVHRILVAAVCVVLVAAVGVSVYFWQTRRGSGDATQTVTLYEKAPFSEAQDIVDGETTEMP